MKWANALAAALAVSAALVTAAAPARADTGPVIALRGHPDVPVVINGRDATYRLVVGDWGLARPGAVPVVVYGPPACCAPAARGYHPKTGVRPRSGRQEIETSPHPRGPAPRFYREWRASSASAPATTYAPSLNDISVTVSPQDRARNTEGQRPNGRPAPHLK